jgi:hypothetical protein
MGDNPFRIIWPDLTIQGSRDNWSRDQSRALPGGIDRCDCPVTVKVRFEEPISLLIG